MRQHCDHALALRAGCEPHFQCPARLNRDNELFCRAANGAIAPNAIRDLFSLRSTWRSDMTIISRISEAYRQRLRRSSRDVWVATAVTLLAGVVIVAALLKAPSEERHRASDVRFEYRP